jgi:putative ABC transport system permease protein
VSDRLWRSEFGGDPQIIDRVVRVSNGTFRVVGIMPPGFLFPDQVDLWAPIFDNQDRSGLRPNR